MNENLGKKVEELEKTIHELEKDLIHDSLTGLKTRNFFEEETNTYLANLSNKENKRHNWFGFKNLSVLFFDIDHFKNINDTFGHDAGDKVLKKVGETIQKNVRTGDTVARWGGEEIVVSLLGASESDAKAKAEEIRKEIEKLDFPDTPELKVTISIGIAPNSPSATCKDLLKNADLALYKAKRNGRNQSIAFSELQ